MYLSRCSISRSVSVCLRRQSHSFTGGLPLPTLYPKKLEDVLNTDKVFTEYPLFQDGDSDRLNEKNVETIQQIWLGANSLDSNKSTHSVNAVLPDHVRQDWLQRAAVCPIALVPVFHEVDPNLLRDQPPSPAPFNFRMLISQFQPDSGCFIMTFLEDYQRDPARASPWCTVSLYSMLPEGRESQGPAPSTSLLRMEYVSHLLTQTEAEYVAGTAMPLLFSDPGKQKATDYTGSVRFTEGHVLRAADNMRPDKDGEVTVPCPGLFNQLSFLNLSPKHFAFDTYVDALHSAYGAAVPIQRPAEM